MKAVKDGFAALNTSIQALATVTSGNKVDLSGVEAGLTEIAEMLEAANTQAATVIGTYSDGARVKVYDEPPAP